jgi:hypothetical protein
MKRTRISVTAVLAAAVSAAPSFGQGAAPLAEHLRMHGRPPVDYVLATAKAHRVTILGEAHWIKQDTDLVAAIVPGLKAAGIDLAAETFPESEQPRIDALVTAQAWDETSANVVMRAGEWPYVEYRNILRAAWEANRAGDSPIRILALGPPSNWREALGPRGTTYDSFMADRVAAHITNTRRPVVVYAGVHHAFTRYYQAELSLAGKATGFMDRMGNILSRRFGEEVFLIALHKPIWCGDPEKPRYCLPFAGRVDCAAAVSGKPVGFDIVGTPFDALPFEPGDYYRRGHPGLRFGDYADGYIWTAPLEAIRLVGVIPLDEYAPDAAARAQVAHANPFTDDKDVSEARLREVWAAESAKRADVLAARGWSHLAGWTAGCR